DIPPSKNLDALESQHEIPEILSPKEDLAPIEILDIRESPHVTKKILSPSDDLPMNENLDFLESPQVNPQMTPPKFDFFQTRNLDINETLKMEPPNEYLRRRNYELFTLYKAGDPSHEQYTLNDEEDGESSSCSSSVYFTCEEDWISSTSSSDSDMPESEFRAFEAEMNSIYMNMQVLSQRLREASNDPN
ncbi:unnamed protein product, partial [Larinioides sclopetarius]